MTAPNYLETFRRSLREMERSEPSQPDSSQPEVYEINEIDEKSPPLISSNSFNSYAGDFPYAATLDALERRCPDHVEIDRWQQCLVDAQHFLAEWGPQAKALGWTARELLGLHTPPAEPHASYHRLSRYDATGLIWLLQGRRVVALSADTAAIMTATGAVLTYHKKNKPALGPLGDTLDDFLPPGAA